MKNVPETTRPGAGINFSVAKGRHLRLGRRGEKIACRFLRQKNFDVLVKNFKCRDGEIDIVARDGATLCFVEVKTRMFSPLRNGPSTWVGRRQAQRVQRAAARYLDDLDNPKVVYRFDLIEIAVSPFGVRELYHWRGHFGFGGDASRRPAFAPRTTTM